MSAWWAGRPLALRVLPRRCTGRAIVLRIWCFFDKVIAPLERKLTGGETPPLRVVLPRRCKGRASVLRIWCFFDKVIAPLERPKALDGRGDPGPTSDSTSQVVRVGQSSYGYGVFLIKLSLAGTGDPGPKLYGLGNRGETRAGSPYEC